MAPTPLHRPYLARESWPLAFVLACGTCLAVPAGAQQAADLRGAVTDSITGELLPRRSDARQADTAEQARRTDFPAYQPVSVGGLDPVTEAAMEDPLDAPATATLEPFSDDSTTATTAARQRVRSATQRQQPVDTTSSQAQTAPALDELSTGTVRAGRIDTADEERNARAKTDNQRTGAIEGLDSRPDDNPFEPLGIRVGTFVVTPTLEQGIGWTSNASTSSGGGASTYSQTGLRLEAISDWSRHSASLRADGQYRKSLSGEEISDVEGGVEADLRLDLGNEFTATTGLGYRLQPEAASSPSSVENAATEPLRQTLTGSAGLSKDIGKLRLGMTGEVSRNIFGDAELVGGGRLSQADRNSTLATVAIRSGYEISPALRPFVEAEVGRRLYNEEHDSDGYARSADRYAVRGGVELDLGDKLKGEIAVGWLTERPDDERLEAISGASIEGNLAWSPMRGTTVELRGSTDVEGTTQAGATGSLLYASSLSVSRELRSNLTGRALVGLNLRDYAGSSERDLIARGELSLTWWLNRYAGITGRASHEIQRSTLASRDYDTTKIYLGMTLQR